MGYMYNGSNCCNRSPKNCRPKKSRLKSKLPSIIGIVLIALGIVTICVLFLPLKAWLLIISALIIALGILLFL